MMLIPLFLSLLLFAKPTLAEPTCFTISGTSAATDFEGYKVQMNSDFSDTASLDSYLQARTMNNTNYVSNFK
jgi:hypothetical protein